MGFYDEFKTFTGMDGRAHPKEEGEVKKKLKIRFHLYNLNALNCSANLQIFLIV